jgi:hypothetical protein
MMEANTEKTKRQIEETKAKLEVIAAELELLHATLKLATIQQPRKLPDITRHAGSFYFMPGDRAEHTHGESK